MPKVGFGETKKQVASVHTSIPEHFLHTCAFLQSNYPVAGNCMSYEGVTTMKRARAKAFYDAYFTHHAAGSICGSGFGLRDYRVSMQTLIKLCGLLLHS